MKPKLHLHQITPNETSDLPWATKKPLNSLNPPKPLRVVAGMIRAFHSRRWPTSWPYTHPCTICAQARNTLSRLAQLRFEASLYRNPSARRVHWAYQPSTSWDWMPSTKWTVLVILIHLPPSLWGSPPQNSSPLASIRRSTLPLGGKPPRLPIRWVMLWI